MNLGPTELIFLLVMLAIPAAFAFATGKIAEGKGHPFALWAVIGFFTGFIGLIIVAVISPRQPPPQGGYSQQGPPPGPPPAAEGGPSGN